jgi:hypothetical protein
VTFVQVNRRSLRSAGRGFGGFFRGIVASFALLFLTATAALTLANFIPEA